MSNQFLILILSPVAIAFLLVKANHSQWIGLRLARLIAWLDVENGKMDAERKAKYGDKGFWARLKQNYCDARDKANAEREQAWPYK